MIIWISKGEVQLLLDVGVEGSDTNFRIRSKMFGENSTKLFRIGKQNCGETPLAPGVDGVEVLCMYKN